MQVNTEQKNIVILGGGFGGVRVALDLSWRIPSGYQIILIDQRGYHLMHWILYEIATVYLKHISRFDYEAVEGASAILFGDIFKGTNVKFLQGRVSDVFLPDKVLGIEFPDYRDPAKNEPALSGLIKYEYLVMALGSETNYFGIKGLREAAYGLKDLNDSLNVRDALEELFAGKGVDDNINIVVGGGGFTGVEFSGELVGYVKKLAEKYQLSPKRVHISVVEAGKCLLPGAKDWLIAAATKRLSRLGIHLVLESPIEKYEQGQIFLAGGRIMPADLLIWTAGVRANTLMDHLAGVDLTKTCLMVNDALQIPQHPEVFGIGDNVYCFNPAKGCPVPATAQRAVDQGRVVANNIARLIEGKSLVAYKPRDPAFIVPIGGKYALADIYGVQLEGVIAWWAKMLVGLKYLLSILPVSRAIRLWWAGLFIWVSND